MGIKIGPQKLILKVLSSIMTASSTVNDSIIQPPSSSNNSSTGVNLLFQPELSTSNTTVIDSTKFSNHSTIRRTLSEDSTKQGQKLLKILDDDTQIFSENDRRCLVRIVVADLVNVHKGCYPPTQAKRALAQALVTEFPRLKNNVSENGWEHYFSSDGQKGFIEWRLMTLRSKLKPHEKKYTKSAEKKTSKGPPKPLKSNSENFNRADMDLKISTLKLKNPNDTNKPLIVLLMDETREFRRYWINTKHPTITEIFEEYPRLLDYNGELIDREFQAMYPEVANNFISIFPTSYMEKILYYVEKNRADLFLRSSFIKDRNLRALLVLVELLPLSNAAMSRINKADRKKKAEQQKKIDLKGKENQKGKKRKLDEMEDDESLVKKNIFPNEFLLRIVSDGTSMRDFVKSVETKEKSNVQPYLITQSGQSVDKTFVQGDGWFINVHPESQPITTFDLLYKTYYVLNVEYPETLKNFYNFIDYFIFHMKVELISMVCSLYTSLSNFNIDNSKKGTDDAFEDDSD